MQLHAIQTTRKLIEKIKDKINLPGWKHNPKLVHDAERTIAITILREGRKASLSKEEVKKLIDQLVERVKNIVTDQQK